jgi:hypothetical protein
MPTRRGRIYSAIAGAGFALLTWILIGEHSFSTARALGEYNRALGVLLLLGFVLGFAVTRNIHSANTGIVAIGNFLFYSVLDYVVFLRRAKLRRRADQLFIPTR